MRPLAETSSQGDAAMKILQACEISVDFTADELGFHPKLRKSGDSHRKRGQASRLGLLFIPQSKDQMIINHLAEGSDLPKDTILVAGLKGALFKAADFGYTFAYADAKRSQGMRGTPSKRTDFEVSGGTWAGAGRLSPATPVAPVVNWR